MGIGYLIDGIPFIIDESTGRMELSPYATEKQKRDYELFCLREERERESAERRREMEMLASSTVTVTIKKDGSFQIQNL